MLTNYLHTAFKGIHPPIETARAYIEESPQYKECVDKGYFTEEELAVQFALMKANTQCRNMGTPDQPVDVVRAEDQAMGLLSRELGISCEEITDILDKIGDGLNQNRAEKNN